MGGGVFNYSCCPCGDALHLLRCPSNGCAMDCRCSHFSTPESLETHVHKTAFWTVRNYDDHCTVVVATCGQSQNVINNCMGLQLVLPLPCATYRLGAAAAKSQARLPGTMRINSKPHPCLQTGLVYNATFDAYCRCVGDAFAPTPPFF